MDVQRNDGQRSQYYVWEIESISFLIRSRHHTLSLALDPGKKKRGQATGMCIHVCMHKRLLGKRNVFFCFQWNGSEPWLGKNVSKKAGGIKTYLIGLEWEFPWLPSFGPTDADFSHFGKENITKEARVTSEEAFQRRESDRPRICFA